MGIRQSFDIKHVGTDNIYKAYYDRDSCWADVESSSDAWFCVMTNTPPAWNNDGNCNNCRKNFYFSEIRFFLDDGLHCGKCAGLEVIK